LAAWEKENTGKGTKRGFLNRLNEEREKKKHSGTFDTNEPRKAMEHQAV